MERLTGKTEMPVGQASKTEGRAQPKQYSRRGKAGYKGASKVRLYEPSAPGVPIVNEEDDHDETFETEVPRRTRAGHAKTERKAGA